VIRVDARIENVVERSGTEFSMRARQKNQPVSITMEGHKMIIKNGYKKRRRLSAEEKWSIYKECEQDEAKIGEILRKHGIYSSDLQNIRQAVQEGALDRLRDQVPGRKKVKTVDIDAYNLLEQDLLMKEKALAELSVLFTSLKKKVNLE
jgi:transposase-like protein